MADIEFPCSSCSTPLVVAAEGIGRTVACPKCSARIVVPGPRRIEIGTMPPPIAPGHRQDYRDYDFGMTVRTRNCTLAYISLALVCFSFITAFVLLLPGIVCGHIALGQCNRDPSMTGKSFAIAALVVGYIVVGLAALMILAFLGLVAGSQG